MDPLVWMLVVLLVFFWGTAALLKERDKHDE